jgi:hypothetical protein
MGPRQVAFGAVVFAVLCGAGLVYAVQGSGAIRQQEALESAGSLVVDVRYEEGNDLALPLDGRVCEALNSMAGVEAAGGVVLMSPDPVAAFKSGPPLPARYVTVNALRVWDPRAELGLIAVGGNLESTGAVSVGSTLVWGDGRTSIIATRAASLVAPDVLASAVVLPHVADAELQECWIKMVPGQLEAGVNLARAAFAGTGATIIPWLDEPKQIMTPAQQWHAFADGRPWVAVSILLAVFAGLLSWTRRSEFAVYRAFGTSDSQLVTMILIETLIAVLPATLGAVTVTPVVAASMVHETIDAELIEVVTRIVIAIAVLTVALTPLASRTALRGKIADQLKDR